MYIWLLSVYILNIVTIKSNYSLVTTFVELLQCDNVKNGWCLVKKIFSAFCWSSTSLSSSIFTRKVKIFKCRHSVILWSKISFTQCSVTDETFSVMYFLLFPPHTLWATFLTGVWNRSFFSILHFFRPVMSFTICLYKLKATLWQKSFSDTNENSSTFLAICTFSKLFKVSTVTPFLIGLIFSGFSFSSGFFCGGSLEY